MIHEDTSISPRCGQKMVFDAVSKQIFMLGHRSRDYDNFKVYEMISNMEIYSSHFHSTERLLLVRCAEKILAINFWRRQSDEWAIITLWSSDVLKSQR